MTILSAIQEACTVIGLAVPTTVFSSTEREHVELAALANEMAKRIAFDGHDWTALKTLATLTGTGAATTFPLPTDYKRMLKKTRLWPSATPYTPLTHYPDTDQWLALQTQNFLTGFGSWTLIGTNVCIIPAVANAATVKFYYITNLIAHPATGSNKVAFTLDSDAFLLDERVLKLGIIMQWKINKGLMITEERDDFETALAATIGADKGSTSITIGRQRGMTADVMAFPGVLGP